MVCLRVGSPVTKTMEMTKTTETMKTSQTATNKELSAGLVEITETTEMTETTKIQGANLEAQQRYFSYRATLVAIVLHNSFVLVFMGCRTIIARYVAK